MFSSKVFFSLKNRFDLREAITDGIDASNTCHVSVEQARNWKVNLPQGK